MSNNSLAKELDFDCDKDPEKEEIEVTNKNRSFRRKKYTIEELLKDMTPDMQHEELDWGKPVGEEIW